MHEPSSPGRAPPFHDTAIGRILIGVAIAGAGALISFVFARYTLSVTPPVAEINPAEAAVRAGDLIEFSAAGSRDPDGGLLAFKFNLGGAPLNRTSVGQCAERPDPAVIGCRFALPGTFVLGVTVASDSGLTASASASVTVDVESGYVGFVLAGAASDDAYRELLYGVDWVAMQALVNRLIVLYDPDLDAPVYAASFLGTAAAREVERPTGALAGAKLIMPQMSPRAQEAFAVAFANLGATIIQLPASEVYTAIGRGIAGGGALMLDNPTKLSEFIAENRP